MATGNTANVQFDSPADAVLDIEERIGDLIDHIEDICARLDSIEQTVVEAAGGQNPLAEIVARLDADEACIKRHEARIARLERRGFNIPVTLHVNDEQQRRHDDLIRREVQVDNLSRDLTAERWARAQADQELFHAQQGSNAGMAAFRQELRAFNSRLDRCADQFCRMRDRLVALEAAAVANSNSEPGGDAT
jgi:hypothetical protein